MCLQLRQTCPLLESTGNHLIRNWKKARLRVYIYVCFEFFFNVYMIFDQTGICSYFWSYVETWLSNQPTDPKFTMWWRLWIGLQTGCDETHVLRKVSQKLVYGLTRVLTWNISDRFIMERSRRCDHSPVYTWCGHRLSSGQTNVLY